MSDNPWRTNRDVIGDIFSSLNIIFGNAKKETEEKKAPEQKTSDGLEEVLLTDEHLSQMRWMSTEQLRMIFGGGTKRKAVFPAKSNPWTQLRWFSADQLEAIFGKDGV